MSSKAEQSVNHPWIQTLDNMFNSRDIEPDQIPTIGLCSNRSDTNVLRRLYAKKLIRKLWLPIDSMMLDVSPTKLSLSGPTKS